MVWKQYHPIQDKQNWSAMEADTKTVSTLYRFPVPGNTTVQSDAKTIVLFLTLGFTGKLSLYKTHNASPLPVTRDLSLINGLWDSKIQTKSFVIHLSGFINHITTHDHHWWNEYPWLKIFGSIPFHMKVRLPWMPYKHPCFNDGCQSFYTNLDFRNWLVHHYTLQ